MKNLNDFFDNTGKLKVDINDIIDHNGDLDGEIFYMIKPFLNNFPSNSDLVYIYYAEVIAAKNGTSLRNIYKARNND